MKIGLIVFSHTGNTLQVAERLKKKLDGAGHTTALERLTPKGEYRPGEKPAGFEKLPDLTAYDALVFGAPVNAFSLCAAMKSYLNQIGPLQGKKAACLVTEFFPYSWMGGNQAIAWMKKVIHDRGGTQAGTGIVNWGSKRRERKIVEAIERITASL